MNGTYYKQVWNLNTIKDIYEDIEIIGFKSQFTMAYGQVEENYFLELETGLGMNEQTNLEGIKKNNFIGTYLLGPILILNPLFTKKLLKMMGVQEPKIALEEHTTAAYNLRLEQMKQKFNTM